jgi:phthiodiolone/phenolphthiodiolone dimycocerosates ketoreductase
MGTVKTALPFQLDRSFPPSSASPFAQAIEASGVVDDFQAWDQLTSWWPKVLWKPENAPAATVMKDWDSYADAFILAAFAAAGTPKLGLAVSTDAIRRGPAELLQSMLTLAGATEGQTTLMLGAGELKQVKPFGYKRSTGLGRLEDAFRIIQLLLETDDLIDFDGHYSTVRRAWIGAARPGRPRIWAMGGGPQLIDLAVRYADGFTTVIPNAFATPERFAREVRRMKRELETLGRDPEKFDFAIWGAALVHDDEETVAKTLDNPLVRWITAAFGRLNQRDWKAEGIESVYPDDWHYALKLLPAQYTPEEVQDVISRVSPAMSQRSWFAGNPKQVAASLQEYVDAGATWVSLCDFLPLVRPLEEAPEALARQIEVCRILKN